MKNQLLAAVTGLFLIGQMAAAGVWEDFAQYHYNGEHKNDDHVAKKVEIIVQETPPAEYGTLEEKLIAVVSLQDATEDAKAISCRFLQQVGSDKAVPAVSRLLEDNVLSHYARLVLESLKTEKADAALRDALTAVPDRLKPGILTSLAARRDKEAVKDICRIAKSKNATVAKHAILSLGAIGGKDAAKCLESLKPGQDLKPVHMQAIVDCADSVPQKKATELCRAVIKNGGDPAHIAAIKVLAKRNSSQAVPFVCAVIKNDNSLLREGVLKIAGNGQIQGLTKPLIELVDELPSAKKAEVIRVLGYRGDKDATDVVLQYMDSEDGAVRMAVVDALGRLADAATISKLLAIADANEDSSGIENAISKMTVAGIDDMLVSKLEDGKNVETALDILIARGSSEATPAMIELTESKNEEVRKKAWLGIAKIGSEKDIAAVVKKLVEAKDATLRKQTVGIIHKICYRAEDKEACANAIAGSYNKVDKETKSILLKLGPVSAGAQTLKMERQALESGDPKLFDSALKALANWPNVASAKDLLKLARTGKDASTKKKALDGYIRIAGLKDADLTSQKRTQMLKTAAQMADSQGEKMQVINGLRYAATSEALDMLDDYMADPELADVAAISAIEISKVLINIDPQSVKEVAKRIKDSSNSRAAKEARNLIATVNRQSALYITGWMMSEVYSGNFDAIFEKEFPPEKDADAVEWRFLKKGISNDSIDLKQTAGDHNNAAVYLRTKLDSPKAQCVRFEMGSDDAITVWLNGKLVHKNKVNRGCKPGADKKVVNLKKGENDLLVKIVQGSGNWGVSFAVLTDDGKPVEGLQVKCR